MIYSYINDLIFNVVSKSEYWIKEYNLLSFGSVYKKVNSYYLAILLSINILCNVSYAQDLASDSAALVAFYNSTGGDNWDNNNKWLSFNPVSQWYGVTVTDWKSY